MIKLNTPTFKAPPKSCDSHLHVFGDHVHYPYTPDRRNSPPDAPLSEYLTRYLDLLKRFGFERMVFVQPSTYGQDNSCLTDALAVMGGNARGIADIDENAPDSEFARLHEAGVRGVRINAGPPKRPPDAGLLPKLLPRIRRLDARCAEMDWMLDFLGPAWLYVDMMDILQNLKSNFTIAHMGMFLPQEVTGNPGFRQLLDLLRHGNRRCWVKLTGPYRLSKIPGFGDVAPVPHALIEAAPDRIIWGSDYPYLSHSHLVDSIELFNLVAQWAPDEAIRRRILVDNPEQLFGF